MNKRVAQRSGRKKSSDSGSENASEFGAQAKAWRTYLGLSRREVAERVGVTFEAVLMLESGATRRPTGENESQYFVAFGVTAAQFWGPVPSKPKAA